MSERIAWLTNEIIDVFNEILDNLVKGFKGIADLIYLKGYGFGDLFYILMLVVAVGVIGIVFYIVKETTK